MRKMELLYERTPMQTCIYSANVILQKIHHTVLGNSARMQIKDLENPVFIKVLSHLLKYDKNPLLAVSGSQRTLDRERC